MEKLGYNSIGKLRCNSEFKFEHLHLKLVSREILGFELYLSFSTESSDIYDAAFRIAIQLKNSHLTRNSNLNISAETSFK